MVLVDEWVTCVVLVTIFVVVGAVRERQLHAEEIAEAFNVATFAGAVHVEARLAKRSSALL